MRRHTWVLVAASGIPWLLSGCSQEGQGAETALAMPPAEEAVEEASKASSPVEREFWLALAEEPNSHLILAREEFQHGQKRSSAGELEKVAAIMNFESRHSHSPRERGLLLASVQELREVARGLRLAGDPGDSAASLAELDHVVALAFRAIAAHQVTLGRESLGAGDPRAAGLYIQETVKAIQIGFDRSGTPEGKSMEDQLQSARDVGLRLASNGDGHREEGMKALDDLDRAVEGLTNVLTSRRK